LRASHRRQGLELRGAGAQFGELATQQFGMGWGGFVALAALVLLAPSASRGAGCSAATCSCPRRVVGCGVLLALFIAYPVSKALAGAFFNEDGQLVAHRLRRARRSTSATSAWAACRRRALRRGLEHAVPGLLTAASTTCWAR
jgi:hypothetical protein